MSKRLILRLLFVLAVVAASAVALSQARAQDTAHPFVGIAQVCVATKGQQPACQIMRSRNDYDTLAQCQADMPQRLNTLANLIHRDHPDWDYDARYACVPDTGAYDG